MTRPPSIAVVKTSVRNSVRSADRVAGMENSFGSAGVRRWLTALTVSRRTPWSCKRSAGRETKAAVHHWWTAGAPRWADSVDYPSRLLRCPNRLSPPNRVSSDRCRGARKGSSITDHIRWVRPLNAASAPDITAS